MTDLVTETTSTVSPPRSWADARTHYEVALKHPWYRAMVELNDVFHTSTVDFWRARGVKSVYLPITTGSISSPMGRGSDSTPVRVTVEGVETYLADSMQFLLEYGCRLWDGGCYYVMPSFRGEAADARHLCQFFHSEAEIVGDLGDVMNVVQDYLRHLAADFLERSGDLIASVAGGTGHLTELSQEDVFRQMTFQEAATALGHDPAFVQEIQPGIRTLTNAGERELMSRFGQFTWVTHYDHLAVPFYQAFESGDETVARNGDLLFGIGESVGCGERHAHTSSLRRALELHEVREDDYDWYLRMREMVPLRTSGFGMGVERFMLWVLRRDDIRDIPLLLRFNGQQIDP
ncbi:amino acid--tRNA ligase-related protein [Nonomuraea diastatica]|nr:amino acid--tRNA ligase-related protein [Nonomuraea diastatica]